MGGVFVRKPVFDGLMNGPEGAIDLFHVFMRSSYPGIFSMDTPGRVVATLGRSSLFVYWIHVEMVYGVLGRPFRRAAPEHRRARPVELQVRS